MEIKSEEMAKIEEDLKKQRLVEELKKQRYIEEIKKKHRSELESIALYQRAANYLSAAQLYLHDNVFLHRKLRSDDIKNRLLGHWGTCPGINLIYAHLNRLIVEHNANMFLVTGPGHGAPANLSNLFLEKSLHEFYPDLTHDARGVKHFIRAFSWPEGFPSHLFPGLPGVIHEGGELGYALATAYGAVMDNPDLIVSCIVGDGESETGPTAIAWQSHKFIDPAESGAVLPIVHINGYKIANPTLFGTMSDWELEEYFSGNGYQPFIVKPPELDAGFFAALEWAYHEIRAIQKAAREDKRLAQPKWPIILLRSPKGMGGIKEIHGEPIEGSCKAHQIPAKEAKYDTEQLHLVEKWLLSYKPEELFDEHGSPRPEVTAICPKNNKRMGMNPHAFGGKMRHDLHLSPIDKFQVYLERKDSKSYLRGKHKASNIHSGADYLIDVIKHNPRTFRIFSPDELESNKLNVFAVTHRDFQWPTHKWDKNIGPDGGRVLEILSEHTLQGWMQGYALTGRYSIFPSYEAFLGIITTMMDQYAKFIKVSEEYPWRLPVPSLNYLATSTLWRQEHNGYSHQNPGFVNTLLNKKGETVRIYLPPDANCLISTLDHCFRSKNYVNLTIATKQEMPQWLTMDEAVAHCRAGASIWKWASTDEGVDPDVVLVGIGDETTLEVMAAIDWIRKNVPDLRIRMVNITDLLILEQESKHPHGMNQELFEATFTADKPVIFNFHGYPSALKQLLYARGDHNRFSIHGYLEEGTTTTPFDMAIRNETSRAHIAIEAIKRGAKHNTKVATSAAEKVTLLQYLIRDHRRYITKHGVDPEEVTNWVWTS